MNAVIQQPELHFRPMEERDLDRVLKIETLAYEFPWTRGIFRDCMRVGYCCWLLESDGVIAGYGVMSVAAGESHILNLCIAPGSQRQGLGQIMLDFLLDMARQRKADSTFLEVRPSNDRARFLYEQNGFVEVGSRPEYYPAAEGREDAVIMARELGDEYVAGVDSERRGGFDDEHRGGFDDEHRDGFDIERRSGFDIESSDWFDTGFFGDLS